MIKKIRHIIEYIFLIIITKLLRLFSVDRSASICAALTRFIGPYLPVSNIARRNLKNVYGDKIDIEKTLIDIWDNFGRYIGEFPFINSLSSEEMNKRVSFSGMENIKEFQDNGRPFMMFLGHQANWDVMIRKINDVYPKFGIVYRPANNPHVDKKLLQERADDESITMIAKGKEGVRDLVKAIKMQKSIAMLVDQKMNDGIEVPFFGMPAMTAPAMARLGLQYDYPIVPVQLIREGRNTKFKAIIHKPMSYTKTGDMDQDCYNIMSDINRTLEGWINERPGQWFWFHNRWKK